MHADLVWVGQPFSEVIGKEAGWRQWLEGQVHHRRTNAVQPTARERREEYRLLWEDTGTGGGATAGVTLWE